MSESGQILIATLLKFWLKNISEDIIEICYLFYQQTEGCIQALHNLKII